MWFGGKITCKIVRNIFNMKILQREDCDKYGGIKNDV